MACLGALALSACSGSSAPAPAATLELSQPNDPTAQDFTFYTHCGVENAFIDGHWWHVADPLYGAGGPGTGPPEGWGDPFQVGRLTVEGSRAVFAGKGQQVVMTPAPVDEPVRVCR